MATSTRYQNLVSRIAQIESHLLPTINPTGYTSKEEDQIRAYCLLTHAEIEAYIEGIIEDVASAAIAKWTLDMSIVSPIIFHLAFTYKQLPNKKELPYSMVNLSFVNLTNAIKSNNGIKESNIMALLKPIGFDMDALLKTTLENFGKRRGEIAHTSFSTHKSLDAKVESSNIEQILQGLEVFDEDITKYGATGKASRVPFNQNLGKLKLLDRIQILLFGKIKLFGKHSS